MEDIKLTINFEIGDFLLLKNGQSKFISIKDDSHSVTIQTAQHLYEEGQITHITVTMDGDPVYVTVEEYLQLQDSVNELNS